MNGFLKAVTSAAFLWGNGVAAQQGSLNLYGMTGLLDMPSAESQPDAQFSFTAGGFAGTTRNTLTFQITPRLSGSFRYTILKNYNLSGFTTFFDRSFDLHYRLRDEGKYLPSLALGMRDFVGTGLYSGEYFVATKSLSPKLKVTGGIGWGRLGSYNSFKNPLALIAPSFATRPGFSGLGGVPGINQWFRGPAAAFAGLEWQTPIDKLTFKAEYSSDIYRRETIRTSIFTRRSPFNFGLEYQVNNTTSLAGYYMYGSELGFRASFAINPKRPLIDGSIEPAPVPVFRRAPLGPNESYDTSWIDQQGGQRILMQNLATLLKDQGIRIESVNITALRAEVRLRSGTYDVAAQTIGRVARTMSRVLPVSVETFVIIPTVNGMATVSVTLQRRDLEDFENDPNGVELSYQQVKIEGAPRAGAGQIHNDDLYPRFTWVIRPFSRTSLFDPQNPMRLDVLLRAGGRYEIAPGFSISGAMNKKLFGNLDTSTRGPSAGLPPVRSDYPLYDKSSGLAVEYLTADLMFKPGRNLYGRISAGYLERMFGGISAELLWKPVNSAFALGAEVNYVAKRAYNNGFGFQSYRVATGKVSGYWQMRNGYSAQIDVGRYLAGDMGATFTFDRRFNNGWKVGAFFTLTDVPFATFGEGSFDKGLRFTIPLAFGIGRPSQKGLTTVMRPITKDGGAQLDVRNRLYPIVQGYHRVNLEPTWGRFWR